MDGTPRQVVEELQAAKVLRAVYSERQLDEVLVDFWLNHFNVFANKGPVKFLVGEYERDVIRPHAWGRFEDLLRATAESPAMLFYLDNWLSADPTRRRPAAHAGASARRPSGRGRPRRRGAAQGRQRGLNENYAREIMELHTLGVDGGYTQKDVTEVARCFTGWTIRGLRQGDPEFVVRRARPRPRGQGRAGPAHQGRRPGARASGHPPAGHPPVHRALHLLQAGAPLRGRRAARRRWWTARPRPSAARTATSAKVVRGDRDLARSSARPPHVVPRSRRRSSSW